MTRTAIAEPIFLTDPEIAKRLGMTSAEWTSVAYVLERSGLPRKDVLFGNRRCWPTVQDFLLRRSAGSEHHHRTVEPTAESKENLDALRSSSRRRSRA